jgi:hypothetical protein
MALFRLVCRPRLPPGPSTPRTAGCAEGLDEVPPHRGRLLLYRATHTSAAAEYKSVRLPSDRSVSPSLLTVHINSISKTSTKKLTQPLLSFFPFLFYFLVSLVRIISLFPWSYSQSQNKRLNRKKGILSGKGRVDLPKSPHCQRYHFTKHDDKKRKLSTNHEHQTTNHCSIGPLTIRSNSSSDYKHACLSNHHRRCRACDFCRCCAH